MAAACFFGRRRVAGCHRGGGSHDPDRMPRTRGARLHARVRGRGAGLAPDDEVIYCRGGAVRLPQRGRLSQHACVSTGGPGRLRALERRAGPHQPQRRGRRRDDRDLARDFFGIAVAPSSTAGQLATDPIPYSLGHCGLMSGVDVDGSWWDPVGFVDIDHSDAINCGERHVFAERPEPRHVHERWRAQRQRRPEGRREVPAGVHVGAATTGCPGGG